MKKILLILFVFSHTLFASSLLDQAKEAQENNNIERAIELYKEAALKDNAQAYFQLGKLYFEGKYVKRDFDKTLRYFNAGYYLKDITSTYNLGIFYASKSTPHHNLERALSIFLELARAGHAPSQNRVGMFLSHGMIIDKDFVEAVKWFEMSSKQGYVNAQCNLAFMYAAGQGVWQNLGRAHAFARPGYEQKNKLCMKVWKDFKLDNYPEDKAFKLKFYTKP